MRVICREGSLEELITQLGGHKLDVVLADEPSTSALRVRTFNQRLSTSAVVLCAVPVLAKRLSKDSRVPWMARQRYSLSVRWLYVASSSIGLNRTMFSLAYV